MTLNLMSSIKNIGIILSVMLLALVACSENAAQYEVPLITSFTPMGGKIDTLITIYGKNFSETPTENVVRINGVECIKTFSSPTEIKVITALGINSGKVSVTVGAFTALSAADFTLNEHRFDFAPLRGKPGDEIKFTGYNFSDVRDSIILFFPDSIRTPITQYEFRNDTAFFSALVPDTVITGNIEIKFGAVRTVSDSLFTLE